MTYKLIIDIGNTYIKFGLFKNNVLVNKFHLLTKSYSFSKILDFIKKHKIVKVFYASVVRDIDTKISNDFSKYLKIKARKISSHDFKNEFNLKPFNVNEIGVDILGFALYLKKLYKKAIGISFGTATFVVGVNDKTILGVAIAPSIVNGIQLLNETTSLIRVNEKQITNNNLALGRNTNEAIISGITHTAKGFVDSIVTYANKQYKIQNIVVSGGKSNYLKFIDEMKNITKIDDIVLLGYNELTR